MKMVTIFTAFCAGSLATALVGCGTPATEPTAGQARQSDLGSLSDEFDNPSTLSNWQRVEKVEGWNNNQLQTFDIGGTQNGWMTMMPYTSTWYRDYRGILVFKPVDGDFVVTTKLHVTGRSGNGAPRSQFSLAGIMVRAPRNISPSTWRPGGENYVFLSLGAADQAGRYQFEVKTTVNSDSQLVTEPTTSGDAVIRVAKIGSTMIMLKKVDGNWSVHRRYSRGDFPSTLQVGLTVYTDWPGASRLSPQQQNSTVIRNGSPDLLALFDYVRYARPELPSTLRGRRLDDPGSVSDSQLLQFLGND
ncbi:MAG: hypothetical protein JST12_06205 [Armatimonadetes bacterium]|nr:hypothetical protein [Armatimonadota bacterium]